jgi:hypothetical protein
VVDVVEPVAAGFDVVSVSLAERELIGHPRRSLLPFGSS